MCGATAASYVISPSALASVSPDPSRFPDQLSARWLLAVGARLVRELGELMAGALRAGKPLATFTIDSEITFASAADRAAFAEDLAGAVSSLAAFRGMPGNGGSSYDVLGSAINSDGNIIVNNSRTSQNFVFHDPHFGATPSVIHRSIM